MDEPSKTYLSKLASLRFFAALMVVCHHVTLNHFRVKGIRAFLDQDVLWCGFTGVTVFYVLSGFVISLANDRWRGWRTYVIGRVARIYPSHLLITVILFGAPLYALIVNIGDTEYARQLVTNLLLIHAWFSNPIYFFSLNGVSWSLSVEIFFYFAFIFLRILKDAQIYGLTIGLYLAVLLLAILLRDDSIARLHWLFYICPVIRLPEFLMGMSAYRLYRSGALARLAFRADFLMLFGLMIGTLSLWQFFDMNRVFMYSLIPALFSFVILIALLRDGTNGYMRNRFLVLLGESSFMLYLIHFKFVTFPLEHGIKSKWLVVYVTLGVLLAIAASVVLHVYVESKLTKWVKRFLMKIFVKGSEQRRDEQTA